MDTLANVARLTKRQMAVLELTCMRGMTALQAGEALGLSPQTIKNHRSAINRKLDCHTSHYACFAFGRLRERHAMRPRPAERPDDV